MAFWIFLFVCNLSIPGLLLLLGWVFRNHAPQSINGVYGYRTRRSMQNGETWRFAQAEFGRLSWRWGLAELPLVPLGMLLVLGRGETVTGAVGGILCVVLCIPIGVMIGQVERALRRTFDEEGRRITF